MADYKLSAEGTTVKVTMTPSVTMTQISSPCGLASRSVESLLQQIAALPEEGSGSAVEALVTATVTASAHWIESAINELFDKCVLVAESNIAPLDREKVIEIGKLWSDPGEDGERLRRSTTTDKWKYFVKHFTGETTDKTDKRPHAARLLTKLRNVIAHGKPWRLPTEESHRELEACLRKEFKMNKGTSNRPFYPYQVLSRGCAEWSAKTARAYIRYELDRLGLTKPMLGV